MDPKWIVDTALPFATKYALLGLTTLGVVLTTQQTDALKVTIGVILTAIVGAITKYVESRIAQSQTTKAVDVRTQALVGTLPPSTLTEVKEIEKKILDPKVKNPEPMTTL